MLNWRGSSVHVSLLESVWHNEFNIKSHLTARERRIYCWWSNVLDYVYLHLYLITILRIRNHAQLILADEGYFSIIQRTKSTLEDARLPHNNNKWTSWPKIGRYHRSCFHADSFWQAILCFCYSTHHIFPDSISFYVVYCIYVYFLLQALLNFVSTKKKRRVKAKLHHCLCYSTGTSTFYQEL